MSGVEEGDAAIETQRMGENGHETERLKDGLKGWREKADRKRREI